MCRKRGVTEDAISKPHVFKCLAIITKQKRSADGLFHHHFNVHYYIYGMFIWLKCEKNTISFVSIILPILRKFVGKIANIFIFRKSHQTTQQKNSPSLSEVSLQRK